MKRLTILRHAKSSWDHPGLSDFDRPLNDRGRKAARRIGKELKRRKMRFDLVLASPAVRVRETLDEVGAQYGDLPEERFDREIYMANADTLLAIVRSTGEDAQSLLLVGHNPGLERLIARLSGGDRQGLQEKAEEKFPTGALAVIELNADHWSEVAEGSGTIVELIFPRDLD